MRWRAGYQPRNLGFQVYREVNGAKVLISPDVIAGSALLSGREVSLPANRGYGWWDHFLTLVRATGSRNSTSAEPAPFMARPRSASNRKRAWQAEFAAAEPGRNFARPIAHTSATGRNRE